MFCENCVKKITIDNSIKCPLCRGVQEMLCNYKLTNEECNIIMKEFTRTQEEYKIGKNYLPFNQITILKYLLHFTIRDKPGFAGFLNFIEIS